MHETDTEGDEGVIGFDIGWSIKKYSIKVMKKHTKKMKMTSQRAKNLVHVKQYFGVSFCKKKFFFFLIDIANEVIKMSNIDNIDIV